MKTYTINKEQYFGLKAIACDPWRQFLKDEYAEELMEKGSAEVSHEIYLKAKSEASPEQERTLNKILGIKEEVYKIGDVFLIIDRWDRKRDGEFILAQVKGSEVCLINLKDGNRWNDPIKISRDCFNVTKKELQKCAPSNKIELIRKRG